MEVIRRSTSGFLLSEIGERLKWGAGGVKVGEPYKVERFEVR